jgi:hypothetical protein
MQRVGAVPARGRYRVSEWSGGSSPDISAVFVAGSPAEPVGVFRGIGGTVTITDVAPGRVEGTFRIVARGFLAASPDHDDVEVTLTGSFVAVGSRVVASTALERRGAP